MQSREDSRSENAGTSHAGISSYIYDDFIVQNEQNLVKCVRKSLVSVPLYQAMKPLIFSLKIFGLLHERDIEWPGKQNKSDNLHECQCEAMEKQKKQFSCSRLVYKFYATGILIVMIVNQFRICTMFKGSKSIGPSLFMKLVAWVWCFHCTISAFGSYLACCNFKGIPAFFLTWQELHPQPEPVLIACYSKASIVCSAIGWGMIILNQSFATYCIFYTFIFDNMMVPLPLENPNVVFMRITYTILNIFLVAATCFIPVLCTMMAFVVYHEFKQLKKSLGSCIQKDGTFIGDLEWFRLRHHRIVQLCSHADYCASLVIGSNLLCWLIISLLIVYDLIWWTDLLSDTLAVITTSSWVVLGFFFMGLVSVLGATINHIAHDITDELYKIKITSISRDEATQLTVFLSRLNGPPIGFSAFGFFIIDRAFIVTICGLIFTYFVVMVQFSPVMSSQCAATSGLHNDTGLDLY